MFKATIPSLTKSFSISQSLSDCKAMEPPIWGNLQSYWTTTKIWKLTVVLDYYEAMETYSRIGQPWSYGNLQWYWTNTKLWKLTVVLDYYEAMETYSRIGLLPS
jgi:hypothetical protein